MSNYPSNQPYGSAPSNGQYAVMTPPPRPGKKGMPLAYSAAGGLLVGMVVGLLLISSGGDSNVAVASNTASAETELAAAETNAAGNNNTEAVIAEPVVEMVETPPVGDEAEPALPVDAPEPVQASLHFEVHPSEVQSLLKIEIDGVSVTTDAYLLTMDEGSETKKISIVASAEGYKDFKQTLTVDGDRKVKIQMRKQPSVDETKVASNKSDKADKSDKTDKTDKTDKSSRGKNSGGKSSGKSGKQAGPGGLLDL